MLRRNAINITKKTTVISGKIRDVMHDCIVGERFRYPIRSDGPNINAFRGLCKTNATTTYRCSTNLTTADRDAGYKLSGKGSAHTNGFGGAHDQDRGLGLAVLVAVHPCQHAWHGLAIFFYGTGNNNACRLSSYVDWRFVFGWLEAWSIAVA